MLKSLIYSTLALALVGCGSQVETFVGSGTKPGAVVTPITPVPDLINLRVQSQVKLSPGSVAAAGTNIDADMTITPTRATAKGTSVDAALSVKGHTWR